MLSLRRGIFCKCNSLEVIVMKKIQAYKHVSHKSDSNKPYFILQFLQFWLKLAYFAIFANFRNLLQFFMQFRTIFSAIFNHSKRYYRLSCIFDVIFQFC